MSREALRSVLIIGLLIAAASWIFLHYYQRVEREVHFGYSPEARSNDYLAATRFLNAMGIPASDVPAPTQESIRESMAKSTLMGRHEVLLMTSKRLTLDRATQQALLGWVRSGGYLIISARTQTVMDGLGDLFDRVNEVPAAGDALFAALGIELLQVENVESGLVTVWFGDMDEPISVVFNRRARMSAGDGPMSPLAEDDAGAVLLSGTIGDGHISVILDRKLLHNRNIGDNDNALLLWHLVNLYGPPAAVRVVSDDNMPALPTWLWGHARELLISLLLLALLAWYAASRRFGPLRQLAPPQRRSLVEHLRASGAYQWRYRYADKLLQAVQDDVRREMNVKHPLTTGLQPTRAAARLADRVRMPEADIRRALGGPVSAGSDPSSRIKPDRYTERMRLLTELRKQL